MPSDRNSAATGPIAIATQCFGPDFGGIEALMTSLADAVTASGREIEVFADHIRRRDAGELARPYPIRRFGSIRPLPSRHRLQLPKQPVLRVCIPSQLRQQPNLL